MRAGGRVEEMVREAREKFEASVAKFGGERESSGTAGNPRGEQV